MSFRDSLFYYHNSGTVAATAVTAKPTVLHTININTVGATPGTITIADGNVSTNTVVAVITPVASISPISMVLDVRLNVGLVVTATGTTEDFTIAYE